MTAGLQVSRLIDVSVNLEPSAAQYPSVTSAMFIGDSSVINVNERYRSYTSLNSVANDFGTTAPEYKAAALFFGQNPQPEQLYIGRWASGATNGLLVGGAISASQQAIANWQAITTGSFHIAVDGNAAVSITALDFHLQTNLNGVATVINTALAAATAGATVSWNGSQFVFESDTTGAASSVAYLTAGAGGVDIHNMLAGTLALGAKEVNGIIAESPLTALQILDNLPVSFYMVMYATTVAITDNQNEAIAAYVEGDAIPHIFAITISDANALIASNTTDLGYVLQQLGYQRTCYQYSSLTAFAIASMLGRAATVNYQGQNTTITLMYKQEPGVTPEPLTGSQADSLDEKNYTYYARYNNGEAIIVNATMANGMFFDDIQGSDALVAQVETDLFNLLFDTPTKIPLTDPGVHTLVTQVNSSMATFLNNGQIGPGIWAFQGFGTLTQGEYMEKGYYVYAAPVSSESPANRSQRKSPPIQCAVIYAGAVQKVSVLINVQR